MTTTPEATHLEVGSIIHSHDEYRAMPVGAKFVTQRGVTWVKTSDHVFESENTGVTRVASNLSVGRHKVHSYPDSPPRAFSMEGEAGEGTECTALVAETLAQYMQRFETTLWGMTQVHGTNSDATARAMQRLQVPDSVESIRPGMVVHGNDLRLCGALPSGTMLTLGSDSAPTVFEAAGTNYLTRRVGSGEPDGHLLMVRSVPGVEPINWAEDATDDEPQRVREFMQRAHEVGLRVKRDQSWCSTFESCMLRVGISETSVHRPAVDLTMAQVAELPPGSVLRLARGEDSLLVIRDDAMTNPARTRRLIGTVEGDWTRQPVEHVHDVSGPLSIRATSHAEMDSAPPGTAIAYGTNRPVRWGVKRESDGRWMHQNYSEYDSRDLDISQVRYVGFPFDIPISGGRDFSRTTS